MVTAQRYPVPLKETRVELMIVNSRFIASLAPVFNVEEARAFIERIRKEFADATHNVPLYRVGFEPSVIEHCSDAGEPAGTAGRPALAVLRGSGLGDVAVVITRYFGGTKLGTGGLVRAYSDSVRAVLAETRRAERVTCHTVMTVLPYRLLERVRILAADANGQILDESFGTDVTITARFAVENLPAFQAALREWSNGEIQAEIIETAEVLMPVQGQ